jgi:hypothetical protein
MHLFNVMFVCMWVKAHYEKSRLLSHCIFFFSRVSYLNFNNVINVKVAMFLHVRIGQNLTKSNAKKYLFIYLFYMISDVKIYLHNKNVCHNVLKKL